MIFLANLSCAPAVWAAEGDCVGVFGELPGIGIATALSEVRARVPKSAGCDNRRNFDGCEFLDKAGYRYVFGYIENNGDYHLNEPIERSIYIKAADRVRSPPLAYGLKWSDSRDDVMRKIRALGGEPKYDKRRNISFTGCWRGVPDGFFWTEVHFRGDGVLMRVENRFPLY